MKILAVTDGADWCLDHLTDLVVRHNPHLNIKVLKVHPKDVLRGLTEIEEGLQWADVVWWQYFRTATQVNEFLPYEMKNVKHMLTHHNQRDKALEDDQSFVDVFCCHTEKMKAKLKAKYPDTPVYIIRHGIDLDEFSYDRRDSDRERGMIKGFAEAHGKPQLETSFRVGYAGRTKPWKRLKNVQDAQKAVPGTFLIGMGRKDDAYANEIDWADENLLWLDSIPDEERKWFYQALDCFVQYSEDGIEEGTMPMLEAMASGVPLITSPVGTAADVIKHEHNGLIVNNDEELQAAILRLKDDPALCERLRSNAWETIKAFNEPRMAREYEHVFNWLHHNKRDLVSVIIPTYQRGDILPTIVDALANQTVQELEVVIADDDPDESAWPVVQKMREDHPELTIKYVATGNEDYGLAQARNMGAIASSGHYLVFLDDRYKPAPTAVFYFIEKLKESKEKKVWVFGEKGGNKSEFVENWSAIRRNHFFEFGGFNERITAYGGMSQECRQRAHRQGIELVYVPNAQVEPLIRTRRKAGRRSDIWRMKEQLKRMTL